MKISSCLGIALCALAFSGDALSQPSQAGPGGSTSPTIEQAKAFIADMIEQHSVSSCRIPLGTGSHLLEQKVLASVSGNRMTLQHTNVDKSRNKQHEELYNEIETRTLTFLLTEINATVERADEQEENSSMSCHYAARIFLRCKATSCMKASVSTNYTSNGAAPQLINQSDSYDKDSLRLNDASIADRLVKAIQFYQQHAPAASPSPF
jgi:hypothetical protein